MDSSKNDIPVVAYSDELSSSVNSEPQNRVLDYDLTSGIESDPNTP